jgi:hypothetical protein
LRACQGLATLAPIMLRRSLSGVWPLGPRSQCRGFYFAGVVMTKGAAILSTSILVATSSPERFGTEGASSTPWRRSIFATAARRSSPSQTAAVANTIEPLVSLILIEYRWDFRMCEVKDWGQFGVQ